MVLGWVWDDETGASITVNSASSWEDYVKKHPEAKPFWNKGWPHFHKVAALMPLTATGSNVFHPSASQAQANDEGDESLIPESDSTPASESSVGAAQQAVDAVIDVSDSETDVWLFLSYFLLLLTFSDF